MPGSNQLGMAVRPVALNTLKLNSNYDETQAKIRLTWSHARSKSTWHGCTTGSNKYSEMKQQLQQNTQIKFRLTSSHAKSKSTWHGCTTGSIKYSEIKQQLRRNTSKNTVNMKPRLVQIKLAWLYDRQQ